MEKIDGYWVDENRNKWNTILYTEQEALQHSKSLVNCEGCINCVDCIYCKGCINCIRCKFCRDCENCEKCHNCTDCKFCKNCYEKGARNENL